MIHDKSGARLHFCCEYLLWLADMMHGRAGRSIIIAWLHHMAAMCCSGIYMHHIKGYHGKLFLVDGNRLVLSSSATAINLGLVKPVGCRCCRAHQALPNGQTTLSNPAVKMETKLHASSTRHSQQGGWRMGELQRHL